MTPAVARLLDDRETQGLPRHVNDPGVLAQVVALLNAKNAGPTSRRPSKTGDVTSDAAI